MINPNQKRNSVLSCVINHCPIYSGQRNGLSVHYQDVLFVDKAHYNPSLNA